MRRAVIGVLGFGFLGPTPASAHSAARGLVLLLPTGYVIFAGTAAVLVSFLAIAILPERLFVLRANAPAKMSPAGNVALAAVQILSGAALVALIWVGYLGPADPFRNLLLLAVWTLWWAFIVVLHPILGNLWIALNPVLGLFKAASMISGRTIQSLACDFGEGWNYWPALLLFATFAWFELVYPAPEDPRQLALAVSIYASVTTLALVLTGPAAWLGRGDPFAIFLSQLGAAAPLDVLRKDGLRLPGAGLVTLPALPFAGSLFVLMTLSSISFDALANTFLWLWVIDVNPLDYPGRSALVGIGTAGLAGAFAVLAVAYLAVLAAGWLWAGRPGTLQAQVGRFVLSLIPISIAFHFAHYLSDTLLKLQYLALAANDPFDDGANLLGLAGFRVTASFQNTASGVWTLFAMETGAVVFGHIVGVFVAHSISVNQGLGTGKALRLEAPFAAFMVVYTAFGLWLLSTPAIS